MHRALLSKRAGERYDLAGMRRAAKVAIVVGGYATAVGIASTAVAMYVAATAGPDRQQYAAMYDFGDSLLFLAVFGLAALPAAGATLFFLRPYPTFWRLGSVAAVTLAATGAAALVSYFAARADGSSALAAGAAVATLRFFLAPLLAVAFALCALFAPTRGARIVFLCAGAVETVVVVSVALAWFQPLR